MLDHTLNVSDYARSCEFYAEALTPLGLALLMEPIPRTGGFGADGKPWFWITDLREPVSENVHVAFTASDRATVDAFHAAAPPPEEPTTARPASASSTTPPTTARASWIPTATTSRRSATGRRDGRLVRDAGAPPGVWLINELPARPYPAGGRTRAVLLDSGLGDIVGNEILAALRPLLDHGTGSGTAWRPRCTTRSVSCEPGRSRCPRWRAAAARPLRRSLTGRQARPPGHGRGG